MTDREGPDNIVLQHLRRFDERQARFEDSMRDIRAELRSIKDHILTVHGDIAALAHREDTQDDELARIRRRLDLSDQPTDQ